MRITLIIIILIILRFLVLEQHNYCTVYFFALIFNYNVSWLNAN